MKGRLAGYWLAAILMWVSAASTADALASDEAIRATVTKSLMSWETLVEEEFVATAHPDLLFAFPRVRTNLEGAQQVFRMWKDEYHDTRVYIHQILVDGDRFAAEYQFATTNNESGKRTVMGTIAIGEVRDGLIVLLKEYTDGRVADLQEKGELPLEEGEEPFPWQQLP